MDFAWWGACAFAASGAAAAVIYTRPDWLRSSFSRRFIVPVVASGAVSYVAALYLYGSQYGVWPGMGYMLGALGAANLFFLILARRFDGFVSVLGMAAFTFAAWSSYEMYQQHLADQEEIAVQEVLKRWRENKQARQADPAPTKVVTPTIPQPAGLDALRAKMTPERFRAHLLGDGWQLVRAPRTSIDDRCGSRPAICRQFVEAQACAGSGLGQCRFEYFYSDGRKLIAITVGDDPVLDSWWIEPTQNRQGSASPN